MEDGGLWTACKESRERMERRFNAEYWSQLRRTHGQKHGSKWGRCVDWKAEDPEHQVIGYFERGNSVQYFNIRPHQDLILLQPRTILPDIPVSFRFDCNSIAFFSNFWGIGGASHLAIELDRPFNSADWHDVAQLASEMEYMLLYLWVIDYKLEVPNCVLADIDKPESRNVFHASDRVFVEVTECDYYEEDKSLPDAFDFVDSVDHIARSMALGPYPDESPMEFYSAPNFGVLACLRKD
ncbi:uncharacterized protein F4822DRAFT_445883 [Hypoxylon trugodes]|uniref:uncharacterized protein n=1 Tax=Hypoxylon trugodes TaxID=326681 RepID=UPI00218E7CFC|nr:uncharacterized protein F4822DRAFT_445883 [Hypoxylon trugodes]KAI1384435.1 hypothetical protein F4822DRAFT_445883 [Hypoxylon trugodes]